MNNALKLISILRKKYWISLSVHLIITSLLFFLTAALALFNLYAIRFNPGAQDSSQATERWIFLVITILTAATAMCTSILTFFTFKRRSKDYAEKKQRIKNEVKKFNDGHEEYGEKNANQKLVKVVTKIITE